MSSNVRSVTVRLEAAVTRYIRDMNRAGDATEKAFDRVQASTTKARESMAQTETGAYRLAGGLDEVRKSSRQANTELAGTTKHLDRLNVSTAKLNSSTKLAVPSQRQLATEVDRVSVAAVRGSSSIDQYSGRLRVLLDLLAIGGPGLLALGGAGAAGIAGLAALFGGATLGALALVGAVQGVGDAVKAVEAARLDPTVANLEKAEEAMSRIAPAAREFVTRFQEIRPLLRELRDAGAEQFFPGLTDSLDSLERLEPVLQRLMAASGRAGGDAISGAAESLASERWRPFLNFLTAEIPQAVDAATRILGDLAHAGAEIWMAFDPTNDRFIDWLTDVADGLDRWASSAQGQEDIRGFLEFVERTAPKVGDFVVAIADALTQVVEAAAPLSGPVLEALTSVSEVIAAIADSDLGTPIMAGVAALALYTRSLQAAAALQTKLTGSTAMKDGLASGGIFGATRAGRAGVKALGSDLRTVGATWRYLGTSAAVNSAKQSKAIAGMGKSAGVVAGLALVTSGAAESFGLASTASLALTGAMIGGGAGALAGGMAGAFLDARRATKVLDEEISSLQATMMHTSESFGVEVEKVSTSWGSLNDRMKENEVTGVRDFFADAFDPNNPRSALGWLSGAEDKQNEWNDALADSQDYLSGLVIGIEQISNQTGGEGLSFWDDGIADIVAGDLTSIGENAAEVQSRMESLQPALDHLGLSWQDFADRAGTPGGFDDIIDTLEYLDSSEGRTDAVVSAFASLDDQFYSTAQSAGLLNQKLHELMDPKLNLSAQNDAWIKSLRTLKGELSDNSRTLVGNSNAALQNREAIRNRVVQLQGVLQAEAEAGATSEELSRRLRRQRKALIDTATAAGVNRDEMVGLLKQYGLTPKLIRTLIKLNGVDAAETALQRLSRERIAHIRVQTVNSSGKVRDATNINAQADGGTVPGQRSPYGDKTLILAAPGEEVITNRNGEADRFRADRAAGRIPAYADGGTVQRLAGGGTVRLRTTADRDIDTVSRSLHRLDGALAAATKAVAREAKQRETLMERRSTLRSGIRSGLDDGIWRPDNVWSSGDPNGFLRANIAEINQFDALTGRIKRKAGKGLKGDALDAILAEGDLATLQAYAGMSKADLQTYVRLYGQQQAALNRVSAHGAGAAYDGLVQQSNRELAEANRELKGIRRSVDRNGRRNSDDHAKDRDAQRRGAGRVARRGSRGYL